MLYWPTTTGVCEVPCWLPSLASSSHLNVSHLDDVVLSHSTNNFLVWKNPKNYWKDLHHCRAFFDDYTRERGIDPLHADSWYNAINYTHLHKVKVSKGVSFFLCFTPPLASFALRAQQQPFSFHFHSDISYIRELLPLPLHTGAYVRPCRRSILRLPSTKNGYKVFQDKLFGTLPISCADDLMVVGKRTKLRQQWQKQRPTIRCRKRTRQQPLAAQPLLGRLVNLTHVRHQHYTFFKILISSN